MIDVAVVGSGISGLSVAWHLSKKGFEVKVFEKEDLPGGNIQTVKKEEGFFPKGAVAFFLLMMAFYAFVWLSTYLVMVSRGQTQP